MTEHQDELFPDPAEEEAAEPEVDTHTREEGGLVHEEPPETAAVNAVTEYGADPTGETDSTDAIERALAENDRVFLPHGVYKVRAALPGPPKIVFGEPPGPGGDG